MLTPIQKTAARDTRPPGYWEHVHDMFPGATVLDDLELFPDDVDAARRIIVRYAVIRAAAALAGDTRMPDRALRIERNIGLNHLRSLPMLDAEVRAMQRMLEMLTPDPTIALMRALLRCAGCAEARGHQHGAYATYFLVYRLSAPARWYREAADASFGIERLARSAGAAYAPRLWRRRGRVMERKAAVA